MRQHFEETTSRDYASQHVPLIRAAMKALGLDAWIVPHADEYQNEYLPAANERLAWATGFTGSAGMAVIFSDAAALFVDGRYTLQSHDQVDSGVFEIGSLTDGGASAYLEAKDLNGRIIGYDPRLHSPAELEILEAAVRKAGGRLEPSAANPLDAAWGSERPAQPMALVVAHSLQYAGESSAVKRRRVAAELNDCGADAALLTAPASVAWLFNVRGGDVHCSPVALGHAILNRDASARLFLAPSKVTNGLARWLGDEVRLQTPEELPGALSELQGRRVMIDPAQSSSWYFQTARTLGLEVIRRDDPCALPRACKNTVEIAGAREAHLRDGAALTCFLHWLATVAGVTQLDEIDVVRKLEAFREDTGVLKDISFDTIAGSGSNGALPHYRPTRRLAKRIAGGTLLLVDSGAQYLDGTTDVTRTVAIGAPTEEMRERFTLVLAGHLALSRVRFPAGTTGSALDALARAPLWAHGLDYDHGTGHGVGAYLGVHEGPQRISKPPNTVALRPGMIVSNEPGYYKAGHYGIRIENLQFVTEPQTVPGGERPMLGFETLTWAPIDRRLIVRELLSQAERAQLDEYHAKTLTLIGPRVPSGVQSWLATACAPL
jgi:Xaa-Pro aminopeptidase